MGTASGARQLDTLSLSALAHPLRVRLFDDLTRNGPATATMLAKRHGESSGATSYHLRQLERFGFVETDPDRGTGRERWWRRVPGMVVITPPEGGAEADPAGHEAFKLVIAEFHRNRLARVQHWLDTAEQWPSEWQHASHQATLHLALDPAETQQFVDEFDALVARWRERIAAREASDSTRQVEVQLTVFPLASPDDDQH